MVVVLFCKSPMKKIIIMNRERSWGGAATQKAANNKCIKKRERERERERERRGTWDGPCSSEFQAFAWLDGHCFFIITILFFEK
jgi:hypothetical protein